MRTRTLSGIHIQLCCNGRRVAIFFAISFMTQAQHACILFFFQAFQNVRIWTFVPGIGGGRHFRASVFTVPPYCMIICPSAVFFQGKQIWMWFYLAIFAYLITEEVEQASVNDCKQYSIEFGDTVPSWVTNFVWSPANSSPLPQAVKSNCSCFRSALLESDDARS